MANASSSDSLSRWHLAHGYQHFAVTCCLHGNSRFLHILVATYKTILCHTTQNLNKSKIESQYRDRELTFLKCEIWGSHSTVAQDSRHLGCDAQTLGAQTVPNNSKASHMVMELRSFNTLVPIHHVLWHTIKLDSYFEEVRKGMKSDLHWLMCMLMFQYTKL